MAGRPQYPPEGAPLRRPRNGSALRTFWLLVLFSIAVIGAGVWQLWRNYQASAAEARPAELAALRAAPDFILDTVSGDTVRLQDFRGKVVLLNFWATWCPPCEAEMPDLDALHRDYGPERGFTVLAVNMQESRANVEGFAQKYNFAFPLLLDTDGAVSRWDYGVRSLPTSLIIDRDGNIRDIWTGQIPRDSMLKRLSQVW